MAVQHHIPEAEAHAKRMIFQEFHEAPSLPLKLLDYKKFERDWYATFVSDEYPDVLLEVTHKSRSGQTHTDLYKRADRNTSLPEPTLFPVKDDNA